MSPDPLNIRSSTTHNFHPNSWMLIASSVQHWAERWFRLKLSEMNAFRRSKECRCVCLPASLTHSLRLRLPVGVPAASCSPLLDTVAVRLLPQFSAHFPFQAGLPCRRVADWPLQVPTPPSCSADSWINTDGAVVPGAVCSCLPACSSWLLLETENECWISCCVQTVVGTPPSRPPQIQDWLKKKKKSIKTHNIFVCSLFQWPTCWDTRDFKPVGRAAQSVFYYITQNWLLYITPLNSVEILLAFFSLFLTILQFHQRK